MWQQLQAKVKSWPGIRQQVNQWKQQGVRIAFTNGCFDLLHYGHVHYLAAAKAEADVLIVGVNSDASVTRLKGAGRPIQEEQSRVHLLAALQAVDAVVIFEQDTPLELIQLIEPDVLLKGGDWAIEQIVGAELVLSQGGQVKSLPFIEGYSTSRLETKIKSKRS